MDDYNLNTITESKNEWCARFTNILTPCLLEGIKSILDEAYKMCIENNEESKYLMTFQNLLNNIPKWSSQIIDEEKNRIVTQSGCNYLDDLLTCVHITQLKSLTSTRVGLKQKKVNIDIPDLNAFIHKAYINCARKIYVNVYLLEKDIMPLQVQKNNRELEIIIKETILNTIRENIPVEDILKIYLDETQETDVEVEEKKETILDKEAIERMDKENREKELERVKQEVKSQIQEESKKNLTKTLVEANKDLNINTVPSKELFEPEILESDYTTDEDDEIGKKLNIDEYNNSSLDLGIKNLDSDPDKIDLESLEFDIKTGENDDEIKLDIEEL